MSTEYRTKAIQYDGVRNILTQNANGPCALLALINTLLLTCNATSPPEVHTLVALVNSEDTVTLDTLTQCLRDIALANAKIFQLSADDVNKTLSLLPTLHEGANINPRFDGGFEESDELVLFRVFNVGMVHGWVISPEDAEFDAVMKYKSYEAAQNVLIEAYDVDNKSTKDAVDLEILDDSSKIKHFFARTATQLTDYGLQALKGHLTDGQILVFFRNNHFNTIIKTENDIYQLVTDQGFFDKSQYVWESLLSINGANNSFFTGRFSPLLEDSSNPFDDGGDEQMDDDRRLAMMMQEEEDQRAASAIQRQYQRRGRGDQSNDTSRNQGVTKKEKKQKKDKKGKKCIVM
ncbi:CYFA0S21e00430g1_1 [Cyberlindnera fabianii]|uniref:CYFA0S21e00430g1_1 n=1 Tax=Cyberlindnera fabianii TaxID=36022 RepID=A0A061BDM7_CYBFA|nr:CYFA0S21e00430g1_1 [Cyberlindnera fabianii]